MSYPTIISDLDGTLLMPNHRLGDYTLSTLKNLTQAGVQFLVATGRSFHDVAGIFTNRGLTDLLIITSNGARIDRLGGDNLYLNTLPADITYQLTTLVQGSSKVCVSVCDEKGWFINVDVPELAEFHRESGIGYQVVDFNHYQFSQTEKVFFLSYQSEDLIFLEEQLEALSDRIQWVYSTPVCIEVMNKGVTKACALKHILSAEQLQNSIAFGDGLNDFEMLQLVKKGCLMSNADPRLIAKLPNYEQIGTNAEEAVAKYLTKIINY